MKLREKNEMYVCAIRTFGINFQLVTLMEELSELIKEASKRIRAKKLSKDVRLADFAEEIADVEIMIEQFKYFWSLQTKVSYFKKLKLARLKKRLNL